MNIYNMNAVCLLVWMSTCLANVYGAGTCDTVSNTCTNGICQLQADKLMRCTCNAGYILDPVNPLMCNPIPPCNLIPGPTDQQCANGMCLPQQSNGQFSCLCFPGYQLNPTNANICDDVDECLSPYTGCAPGMCFNVPGDYACSGCVAGYTLMFGKCEVGMVAPANPKPTYTASGAESVLPYWFIIDEVLL